MNRLGLIKTSCTDLAALMLSACTQDEVTDGNIQDLPEGKYPLMLTATAVMGKELYWRFTNAATVTTWYSPPAPSTDGTVNFNNQASEKQTDRCEIQHQCEIEF